MDSWSLQVGRLGKIERTKLQTSQPDVEAIQLAHSSCVAVAHLDTELPTVFLEFTLAKCS
jgi:hypothetical protein